MNTQRIPSSTLRHAVRAGAFLGLLALAACGKSQNWQDGPGYVSVGGTVTGLSGTVTLQNNATDDLAVASTGAFTFKLSIPKGSAYAVTVSKNPAGQTCTVTGGTGTAAANVTSVSVACQSGVTVGGTVSGLAGTVVLQENGAINLALASNGAFTFPGSLTPGSTYSVTVLGQPQGQTCTVARGSGTATANVSNIAVTCATFTLRALPAVYSTGKAVNYSAYRTVAGPGVEVPTDAQVKEDLALQHAAGYRLLRLFGSDPVSEKILALAATNFPDMQFQLGVYIFGIDTAHNATCDSNPYNADQITTGIRLANQYANVATVSVGNETSFFRQYMPVACLAGYIQTIRSQVAQPITADDDYTFYCDSAAVTPAANECAAAGSSDPILAITDFVSIHTYPMSNPGRWNSAQAGVAAGPARAQAMMEASLANAKRTYNAVAAKTYRNAAGAVVSVGASLPIVIGETGWKARRTNYASTLEQYAATPMNAKWYFDLLYGSAPGATLTYAAWEGSANGPKRIFYFESFDEIWKGEGPAPAGTDDGWGLWGGPDPTIANYGNLTRTNAARYILCGAYAGFSYGGVSYPAAPACNIPETYPGAGFLP